MWQTLWGEAEKACESRQNSLLSLKLQSFRVLLMSSKPQAGSIYALTLLSVALHTQIYLVVVMAFIPQWVDTSYKDMQLCAEAVHIGD